MLSVLLERRLAPVVEHVRHPEHKLVVLEAEPSADRLWVRLLDSLAEDDGLRAAVFGAMVDRHDQVLSALHGKLTRQIQRDDTDLEELGLDPSAIWRAPGPDDDDPGRARVLGDNLDRLARALYPVSSACVLAVRVSVEARHRDSALQALRAVAMCSLSPRVTVLAFVEEAGGVDLTDIDQVRARPLRDAAALATAPVGARVLVVPPDTTARVAAVWSVREGEPLLAAADRFRRDLARAVAASSAQGAEGVAQAIARQSRKLALGTATPSSMLTAAAEAAAILSPARALPLSIRVEGIPASLLAAGATDDRVRYLLSSPAVSSPAVSSDPASSGAGAIPPRRVITVRWRFGRDELKAALKEDAARPEPSLPPGRLAMMMSGAAIAEKQPDEAVRWGARAVEQVEPGDEVAAWLTLGNARLFAREHGSARDAYAVGCRHAVDAGQPELAALMLQQVGHCHFLSGEYRQAEQAYEVAAQKLQGRPHVVPSFVQARTAAGDARWYGGDHAGAAALWIGLRDKHEAALMALDPSQRGITLGQLHERIARAYDEAGREAEAEQARTRAREAGSPGVILEIGADPPAPVELVGARGAPR